ncbi:MAG: molybdopterin-dependent oxidoreductase [Caldilineaceae bacterium]|nr:molybdopterin-dependent oxidoreductase [Caldilineaceae bacterium]
MNNHAHHHADEPDWVHGHPHEPNPAPPTLDTFFEVRLPGGVKRRFDVHELQQMPQTTATDCLIVSTGHGTSGPFTFTGVRLLDFLQEVIATGLHWQAVDVISSDGFGTRLTQDELRNDPPDRPSLLAYSLDGHALTREQGLVRLIVPTETDDALKQVKWVAELVVHT